MFKTYFRSVVPDLFMAMLLIDISNSLIPASTVISNSYISKILQQFTWRKFKWSLTWFLNMSQQNITMPHRWSMRPALGIIALDILYQL